jgi:glycerophosphoryl diester phosphodiesterase
VSADRAEREATRTAPAAEPSRAKAGASTPRRSEVDELKRVAKDTRAGSLLKPDDDRAWDPASDDLTAGRNAHHSNTPAEMREALEGDNNWLEGDLRVDDDGKLVMAHDAGKEREGLTLDEWLEIGGEGERGMKVDVKEPEAIPELLDALEASGVPDGRIMINVGATQVDEEMVVEMRERFPDAWLALNPRIREGEGYRTEDLEEITELADAAGGRIAFPIRWDIASDEAIQALKPHGRVSIWTAASQGTPGDTAAEVESLRERGVDGVVDLGAPLSNQEKALRTLNDIWESGFSRGARDFFGDAFGAAGSLFDGARDIAGDIVDGAGDIAGDVIDAGGDVLDAGGDLIEGGLDVAGDIAEDLPLVGGLFD